MVLARLPLRAVVALRHRPRAFGDAEHGCIEHHQRACTLTIAASSKTPVLVERSAPRSCFSLSPPIARIALKKCNAGKKFLRNREGGRMNLLHLW